MFDKDGKLNVPFVLRSAVGVALVALGAWMISGLGPQIGPHFGSKSNGNLLGWSSLAAGVWLIPFLRRSRTNKRS